nr:hypothetical protein [Tanacetum cinerariifolium]
VDDTRKENLKSNDGFQHAPRKTFRGFNIGPKVYFKPSKQVYKTMSNKNEASTSCTKKSHEPTTTKVGSSNPFDVLNPLENDVDLVANDVAKVDPKVIMNPKVASCVEHVVTTSSNVNESGKSSEMVIDDSESDAEDVDDATT